MIVYVVTYDDFDYYSIRGVFSSKEKSQSYIDNQEEINKHSILIFTIDDLDEEGE
jgi:hypothetical protein